jgi:hypothetical protein
MQMCARLGEKVAAFEASHFEQGLECDKCRARMHSKGRRACSFLTRFGKLDPRPQTFRCDACKVSRRLLLDQLGVEAGRVSGSLARLLALLGVVVPYELAAQLVLLFFGIEVSAMTVWRSVQRLGEAADKYTEEQACFFADPRCDAAVQGDGPLAVLLGVDGCALGMQVRTKRRRRKANEVLPARGCASRPTRALPSARSTGSHRRRNPPAPPARALRARRRLRGGPPRARLPHARSRHPCHGRRHTSVPETRPRDTPTIPRRAGLARRRATPTVDRHDPARTYP